MIITYQLPIENRDKLAENLHRMEGYLEGLIEKDQIPAYARESLRGFLQNALESIEGLGYEFALDESDRITKDRLAFMADVLSKEKREGEA